MNKKAAALLAAGMLLSLSACKQEVPPLPTPEPPAVVEPEQPEKPTPTPDKPVIPPAPLVEEDEALVQEKSVQDSIEEIVSYTISTPEITARSPEATQIINDYYASVTAKALDLAWGETYEQAQEYQSVVDLTVKYQVHYNDDHVLSVLRSSNQLYRTVSQEHPNSWDPEVFAAETFDLRSGGLITLDDLFTVPYEEYMPRLVSAVRLTIEQTPPDYGQQLNEDWESLLLSTFDKANFYLTDDALHLFYQADVLGPGAAQFFGIDMDQLELILKDD